jgi:hypothetical protein
MENGEASDRGRENSSLGRLRTRRLSVNFIESTVGIVQTQPHFRKGRLKRAPWGNSVGMNLSTWEIHPPAVAIRQSGRASMIPSRRTTGDAP